MRLGASVKASWLCALLAAVSALAETTVYRKLGDEVVLTPDSVPDSISVITWKEATDLAMDWEKSDPDIHSYRQFKDRGHLNTSTGAMTITQLTRSDSNKYTIEINGNALGSFDLRVISAVAVPTISQSCNDEKTSCRLTCEGGSTEAEPLTYTWKSDNGSVISSDRQLDITLEDLDIKQFSCELRNPVSSLSSVPVPSPLSPPPPREQGESKVVTGVVVFVCMLVPVLLLVIIHRCKAGMWFFQKESMPWEGDFWQKDTSEGRTEPRENQTEEQKLRNNSNC